jgi:hypothetical protein
MPEWKSILKMFAKRLVVALGIMMLFAILATIPGLGYFGGARTRVVQFGDWGLWTVDAHCDICFNPFLYPFSWVRGSGHYSGNFTFYSIPTFAGGGESWFPVWRMPKDLEDEAVLIKITSEIPMNMPYVLIILIGVSMLIGWNSYLYFIGGLVGFMLGAIWGAVIGFVAGALVIVYVIPRIRKNENISRAWENLLSRLP